MMEKMFLIGGKLAIICSVAAIVLAVVNAITEPVIVKNKAEALQAALDQVVDSGTIGKPENIAGNKTILTRYPVRRDNSLAGYVLKLLGMGYGGEMTVLAYFTLDGTVRGAVLMENSETPGLGKQAEDPGYMRKYVGTGDKEDVPTRKDELTQAQADSVSGATITFQAVGKVLQQGSDYVAKLGGNP